MAVMWPNKRQRDICNIENERIPNGVAFIAHGDVFVDRSVKRQRFAQPAHCASFPPVMKQHKPMHQAHVNHTPMHQAHMNQPNAHMHHMVMDTRPPPVANPRMGLDEQQRLFDSRNTSRNNAHAGGMETDADEWQSHWRCR